MFHKIIKRGHKKGSKAEAIPVPTAAAASNVTVNHASRLPAPAPASVPHWTPSMGVPQNPGVVEFLPMVNDVPLPERHATFIRKVQICCILFDLTDTNAMKSVREKEIKRQTLAELIDLVQSGSFKMNEIMQEEMVNMIALNIFRCLRPASYENAGSEGRDLDEDEDNFDPSWLHLQLVYELLLRYVVSSNTDSKIAKRFIDHPFVMKLFGLFDSEDPREREYLKIILHRIYSRFMIHRPLMRNAINDIFYRYIFESKRHSGISELLEIIGSIINGFALPMREEHKLFLVRVIIPLHKIKFSATYHEQLSYCTIQFVEKDYMLADIVIRGLLKYWPVSNCGKEVLLLGELEDILDVTQPTEFKRCMVPLFRRIGRCINSPHFQVAERALFWWNNDQIVGLISDHRTVILPILFDAIENNLQCHWNQTINGLTSNIRKMFLQMDSELFEECQMQHEEKNSKAEAVEEQRFATWKRLEEVAAQS